MHPELENLCGAGKPLKTETPDAHEFAGLLRTGMARLHDARNHALALESRFDLAYNAAHALCLAALRRMGYRAGNRYIVFQVLPHTLGLGPEVWRVLDKCHNTRNLGEYEGLLDVDERLVKDLIAATQAVAGSLAGTTVTDDLLKNLAGIRSDGNILPQPMMNVSKFSLAGGDVAVVEVQPSDLPPVRYKGRVHIRVGPRKAIANEQEERALSERRVTQAKSFDAQPCSESNIDDLAPGQFDAYRREAVDGETIAANNRSLEQQLASLRLYDPDRRCATNAGILLVGKNPRFYLPGAYVQYLELPGTSLTELPTDQAEVAGDLPSVLKELLARLRLLIKTSMVPVSALQEKLVPNYPEGAIRELLMNAVMHRNYNSNSPIRFYVFADHIEIQNPGGLYGEATQANFPTRNSYRNPVIAEALKSLGFVNRFGYGVQRAQALLAENGNPPAEFDFDEHSVVVKIRKRP